MMNTRNPGSKESLGVKFKDNICTKLCLKLWLESDQYFCNITQDGSESDSSETKILITDTEAHMKPNSYFLSND